MDVRREYMAKYNQNYDQSSQWAHPGKSSWSTRHGVPEGQTDQWLGQTGQHHDLTQTYYDPNNPQAWRQGAYRGQGPKKPPHRRWWFWTIVVVVLIGLIALVMVLLPTGAADDDASTRLPFNSDVEDELPGTDPSNVFGGGAQIQREGNSFELGDGGTKEDALLVAQDSIDSDYQSYGPADLVYFLRMEGFQNDAIEHALNHVEVDWPEQAVGVAQRMAENEHAGYSKQELHDSLVRASFSDDEIHYALDNVEIDYKEQALRELQSYRELFGDDTPAEARKHLERAEFEAAEIDYAFDKIE